MAAAIWSCDTRAHASLGRLASAPTLPPPAPLGPDVEVPLSPGAEAEWFDAADPGLVGPLESLLDPLELQPARPRPAAVSSPATTAPLPIMISLSVDVLGPGSAAERGFGD